MKKSKVFTLLLALILVCCMIGLLTACNKGQSGNNLNNNENTTSHTHSWESKYSIDSQNHWFGCDTCQNKNKLENHSFKNSECKCGYIEGTDGLEYKLNSNDSYSLSGIGNVNDKDIVISNFYVDKPVTSISNNAFKNCNSINSVRIPNSIVKIEENTFTDNNIKIYCDAENEPSGWEENWNNSESIVVWNYNNSVVADDEVNVIVNKIKYKINNYSATVVKQTNLSGDIVIEENVTYNNISYQVTKIEAGAFESCSGITGITIPKSVKDFGNNIFDGCNSLISANVPAIAIRHLPKENLENVIVNSGESISNDDFKNCTKLKNITIADSIKSISTNTFADSAEIVSATIPTLAIKHIPKNKLQTLILTSGEAIDKNAFEKVSSLQNVTICSSIKNIGSKAFAGCTNIQNLYISDDIAWCAINFASKDANPLYFAQNFYIDNQLVIDLDLNDNITNIEYAAFVGYKKLRNINLPQKLTNIKYGAFEGCSGLQKLVIPNNVTNIGDWAFKNCTNMSDLTIGNNVTVIGALAFGGCTGLAKVNIGKNVKTICDYAFQNCTGLSNIEISDSVTSIGNYSFGGCNNISYLKLSNNLAAVGNNAFNGCSNLTSITIPDSLNNFGIDAFKNCNKLSNVNINNLKNWCNKNFKNIYANPVFIANKLSLYDNASKQYNEITNLKITLDIVKINEYVFAGLSNKLEKIEVLSEGDKTNTAFVSKNNCLMSVDEKTLILGGKNSSIASSVNNIASGAFANYTTISNITLSGNVNVGDYAFVNCTSLKTVNLQGSIIINSYAFSNCSALDTIIIQSSSTKIGAYAFENCGTINTFNFSGNKEEWKVLFKGNNWDNGLNYVVQCSDGRVDKNGNEI